MSPLEINRQRLWTIVVLIAFCAVGIHQGGAAQVLCIGADGHIEVETSGIDCCKEAAKSQSPDRNDRIVCSRDVETDDCGACIDIPLMTTGRVAIEPVSINRPDGSACPTSFDDASVDVLGFASRTDQVIHTSSSPGSGATLPLLL